MLAKFGANEVSMRRFDDAASIGERTLLPTLLHSSDRFKQYTYPDYMQCKSRDGYIALHGQQT
jgi:hypothetical protein